MRSSDRNPARAPFWSAYSVVYDLIWDSPLTRGVAVSIAERLHLSSLTLDLGCGTGLISRELTARGHSVIGVDNNSMMLARARRTARVSRTILTDAAEVPLASECTTAITIANTLHVHADPDSVLEEAARLLEPGGVVVVTWPFDDVSHHKLNSVELALGRSWPRAVLADAARKSVSLPAQFAGVKRHGERRLRDVVRFARHVGLTVTEEWDLHGCQHLVALRRDGIA